VTTIWQHWRYVALFTLQETLSQSVLLLIRQDDISQSESG